MRDAGNDAAVMVGDQPQGTPHHQPLTLDQPQHTPHQPLTLDQPQGTPHHQPLTLDRPRTHPWPVASAMELVMVMQLAWTNRSRTLSRRFSERSAAQPFGAVTVTTVGAERPYTLARYISSAWVGAATKRPGAVARAV